MKFRLLLAGALVVGSIFVGAAPASATCHPEKPSTCEPEIDPMCDGYITLPNGSSFYFNFCDPEALIPQ